MSKTLGRRTILQAGALLPAALLGGGAAEAAPRKRKRVLRIAHLTDVHVQPELRAEQGMEACLRHALGQKDRPDLVLNGGDSIMDGFAASAARTRTQWEVWDRALQHLGRTPIRHCIGNHDIWGWARGRSGATGTEPLYGKKWAMERFGLTQRYYSFDQAGWHFVALDSTFPHGTDGYTARLDDEQFEWLKADLAATPARTPVLVFSHIPILCGCALMDGNNEKSGDWVIPGSWMHIDARRIKDLFYQHPNVKVALSGHIHLRDRLDYNGVTYLCNGAVSGAWWKGRYGETDPGYGLVDLYSDGTVESRYVNYGWTAEKV